MMRIKKTFTFALPDIPAVPIDDANDLTLEIEDEQTDDECVGIEEIKLETCSRGEEESQMIFDDEVEEDISISTDFNREPLQQNKVKQNKVKVVTNYKIPVYKCTVEKCNFTTNFEKYLVFHLKRHQLCDDNKPMKVCKMCREFRTDKHYEMISHRMSCPSCEKLKKFCTYPDCTYVAFKWKQMMTHVEKYHSNIPNKNPFDKKNKSAQCKRKNKNEAKSDKEKKLKTVEAEPQSNKDVVTEEQVKDKTEEQIEEKDGKPINDKIEETIKETIEQINEKIEQQTKEKITQKDTSITEDRDSDSDEEALKIDESYEDLVDVKLDEQEREMSEEEAKRRSIDEQIENTINLLCDINKGNKKDFLQEPADSLPFKLESVGTVDSQTMKEMQETACINSTNSFLNSFL